MPDFAGNKQEEKCFNGLKVKFILNAFKYAPLIALPCFFELNSQIKHGKKALLVHLAKNKKQK